MLGKGGLSSRVPREMPVRLSGRQAKTVNNEYEIDRITVTGGLFGVSRLRPVVRYHNGQGHERSGGEGQVVHAGRPMRWKPLSLALAAGVVLSACSRQDDKPGQAGSSASSGNPLTAPADYVGAAAKAKGKVERGVEMAGLKKSIQLFYAQEGRYPKSLKELVSPDYLPSLPKAPAGMKFDYNPKTGEVRLVGE